MFSANYPRQATHLLGAVAAATLVTPYTARAQTARPATADGYRVTPPAGWSVREVIGPRVWLVRGDTFVVINRLTKRPSELALGEAQQMFQLDNGARGYWIDLGEFATQYSTVPYFILMNGIYFAVDASPVRPSHARWRALLSDIAGSLRLGAVSSDSAPVRRKGPLHAGIMNRRALSLPEPAYPTAAGRTGAQRSVVVRITVDEDGNVIAASAESGDPVLHEVSVAAARKAKFGPTIVSGQPVRLTGILVYTFSGQ